MDARWWIVTVIAMVALLAVILLLSSDGQTLLGRAGVLHGRWDG